MTIVSNVFDFRVSCIASQDGDTALIMAVIDGHLASARLLVESGANKDATDNVRPVELFRCRCCVLA
jgi:ankyrin repeat protein